MKRNYIIFPAFMFLLLAGTAAKAQLNPLSGAYFQNQYLANPAMAGLTEGLHLNLGFRRESNTIPGSPVTQAITADYQSGKVGLGLNVFNEKAGLQKQTRLVGTYAYHLPLNDGENALHFGISVGFMNERIDYSDVNGDPSDISVINYNQREVYVDGDFGLAYTTKKLTIQAAIPNMKNFLGKESRTTVDQATFFTSISYKIGLGGAGTDVMAVEPKVTYRGVHGWDNLWDAGANLTLLNNQLSLLGMYHSTQSATFGFGYNFRSVVAISGMYTTETSDMQGYSNGNFELGLTVNLNKRK